MFRRYISNVCILMILGSVTANVFAARVPGDLCTTQDEGLPGTYTYKTASVDDGKHLVCVPFSG